MIKGISEIRGTNRPVISASRGDRDGDDRDVTLLANYIKVRQNSRLMVYKYHVTFEPDVGEYLRMQFVQKHADIFKGVYIYDKQSTIMSTVELRREEEFVEQNNNYSNRIKIRKVQTVVFGSQDMMQFLNSQLRVNLSHLKWMQVLRNYFDFSQRTQLREQNIEIMPGVTASIRECKLGTLMALDTIHKVVQMETCLDLIRVSVFYACT